MVRCELAAHTERPLNSTACWRQGELPERALLEPWFGHESAFIRIALHLDYCAAAAGMFLFRGVLCAGRRYGLSHVSLYTDAPGNEPKRLIDRPICEIIHQTPPVAFTLLWNADVQRYGGIELLRQENDDDGIRELDRADHAPAATAAD